MIVVIVYRSFMIREDLSNNVVNARAFEKRHVKHNQIVILFHKLKKTNDKKHVFYCAIITIYQTCMQFNFFLNYFYCICFNQSKTLLWRHVYVLWGINLSNACEISDIDYWDKTLWRKGIPYLNMTRFNLNCLAITHSEWRMLRKWWQSRNYSFMVSSSRKVEDFSTIVHAYA